MKINIHLVVNRAVKILLFYLFFINMAESFFGPILAIFVIKNINGATLQTVGFSLAFFAIAKSFVQIPVSRFLDTHDGERDDFYVLMLGAILEVLYPFTFLIISKVWHLYLLETMVGISSGLLMAAYYSLFARHVDHGSEGLEWSLFSVWSLTLSGALGAALGGWLADTYGFQKLFIVSGSICFLITFVLPMLFPLLNGQRSQSLSPFAPIPNNPTLKK